MRFEALVKAARQPSLNKQRESLMGALLNATAMLTQGQDVESILRSFCDTLVAASPHIRMAWLYVGDPDAEVIRPSYAAGPTRDMIMQISIGNDPQWMLTPIRTTLRTGQPVVARISDPVFGTMQNYFQTLGVRMTVCIAFRAADAALAGLVSFGADTEDYFDLVGLEPFFAFARLGEVALEQAVNRQRLKEMADFDHLTGLLNRRAFDNLLMHQHAEAAAARRP